MEPDSAPFLLVAGAVPHETAELARRVGATPVPGAPWPLAEGELGEARVGILSTGVGPAAAAGAVAWAASATSTTAILGVGSCGSYDLAALPQEAVALIEAERFGDLGTALDDGSWVEADALGLGEPGLESGWFPLEVLPTPEALPFPTRRVRALTVQHVTGTDALGAARARRTGATVESMEGAAVALVARRLGLPYLEVRGVANHAGRRDREGWKVRPAGRNAQEVAWRWLEALASGEAAISA